MATEHLEAKKKAMSLLEHMDRTEWELRDKLEKKEFSEEAIEAAIEYVKSYHYIDDLRYARHFVSVYRESRSIKRMRQDMYRKHVPEEYMELALEEMGDNDQLALQVAVQKVTKGRTDYTYEEKQKLAAKLFRKGFSFHDIKRELNL